MLYLRSRKNKERPPIPVGIPPEGYLTIKDEYSRVKGKHPEFKQRDYDDERVIHLLEHCCSQHPRCPWRAFCCYYYDRWNDAAPIRVSEYDWEALLKNKHGSDPSWMPSFSFDGMTVKGQPEAKRWEFEPTRLNMMMLLTGISRSGETEEV